MKIQSKRFDECYNITCESFLLFPDCRDVLIRGTSGPFIPEEGNDNCEASGSNFNTVTIGGGQDHVVFVSNRAASLTELLLKVDSVCADGGALTVSVAFFNPDWYSDPVSTNSLPSI